ncbi:MAG: amidohydrolase family protein [Halobacteriaceae archaeon]
MASKQAERALALEELTIVDADSHLSAPADELVEYMPADSGARRMVERAGNVGSEIFTKTRATPAFPNDGDYDGHRAGHDPGTPEGKLGFMEEFGLDHSVLTPGGGIATINNDRVAVAWASAYNDWLVDNWLDADDRLSATAAVANQRPDMAAEEVDRVAGEGGVVGVQMPGAGLIPPAGNWMYEPIYEAAESHGLPVVMHSHDNQAQWSFPVQRRWAETFTESHAFTFPVEAMWHLISLVCNGVPERFPDLEFVFQEPGFEWVPWMMWRLDDHYFQNSEDLPMLSKRPSEYVRDQFYFTTQPLGHTENYRHMASIMDIAGGGDTLLFSTDHPHPDFDPPEEVFAPAKTGLDDEDVRGVMGETALDLFGLA